MSLTRLPSVGENTGMGYVFVVIVGDCHCPSCHNVVYPQEPKSGDFFFTQCDCGRYIEAYIVVDLNGRAAKWVVKDSRSCGS